MNAHIPPPDWISGLRYSVPNPYVQIADDVWAARHEFIRWPQQPLLFMPGVVRGVVKFHKYTAEHRAQFKQANVRQDPRTNGPAVMAFRLAGGERPVRATGKGWSIHHIYDGKFPAKGKKQTTHAVTHPDYFTQAAGLVAIHPIADALADELAYFAWLLRWEAIIRFRFDPDGVFGAL